MRPYDELAFKAELLKRMGWNELLEKWFMFAAVVIQNPIGGHKGIVVGMQCHIRPRKTKPHTHNITLPRSYYMESVVHTIIMMIEYHRMPTFVDVLQGVTSMSPT